jgi:Capsule assembly protein Wzi
MMLVCALSFCANAAASTYVVFIPLDSPIYEELDALNGLGLLDTYLSEIKPMSRVEAARLVLEAEQNLDAAGQPNPLAHAILRSLRVQLGEEIGWLERNAEDDQPTMIHPIERFETQYVFSGGERRRMVNNGGGRIDAEEATPLVPNNDDLPTSSGSNEIARLSAWAGTAGFLTSYGEGALAGPLSGSPANGDRTRLLRGQIVASLGNTAVSFGYEEMAWGTGYYSNLSQSDNARPLPALRIQNIHPTYLPGFLRYLGPFRGEAFFGQLDHGRQFSRPWISGQIVCFKPLPTFEIGGTHVVMFGGNGNDNYSVAGFLGRASGLATGSPVGANSNSRAGIYLKIYFPSLRNTQIYQEILGEDTLATEFRPIGRFLPFLAISYQGGVYVPRLTSDGLTTARFEYTILEPNYSTHDDGLYWTYYGRMMGDPMGPNASRVDLAIGRWLGYPYKAQLHLFYTERAPKFGLPGLLKERSGGMGLELLSLPTLLPRFDKFISEVKLGATTEYVTHINYSRDNASLRAALVLSGAIEPAIESLHWR